MSEKYLIAGGDLRFAKLADYLAGNGSCVYTLGLENPAGFSERVHTLKSLIALDERVDHLVLPLPVSNDGVNVNMPYSSSVVPFEQLIPAVKENGIVFGGRFTDRIKSLFEDRGLVTEDYSEREEFAVLNAQATAEGAIQVAMEETASALSGQKILIIGMGRIAKLLVYTLKGFNADITVAARKYSDLAWAEVCGCKPVRISSMKQSLGEYTLVFNTAPAVLLDKEMLLALDKGCLVIDLASKPGGVDFETAARLGVRAVWLLSLPGKVAPLTAGITIGKTISNILEERRNSE
ncbi:MAG: dipicolinate synthase subunit DpsA [Oscillospiraceae bacterium]|nr:dipicolinate synthase subunit DpsA [Oscillospiraceae bacterium]